MDTFQTITAWACGLALFVGALCWWAFRHLSAARWGRMALLVGVALLPVAVSVAGLQAGVAESSRTRFCLSCHEMQDHGKSLFVDDRRALAAVHYQNRLIDRDKVCFSCHTDYALFGDVKAKLNGLRHVWVHYLGTIPERFALYEPYSNRNCLHCHEDGRRFVENAAHTALLRAGTNEQPSCLGCHEVTHDLDKVKAQQLWSAP